MKMKKKYFFPILAAALLVATVVFAQFVELPNASDGNNADTKTNGVVAEANSEEKSEAVETAEGGLASLRAWKAGDIVSAKDVMDYGIEKCFMQEPISDALFARMQGKSYPKGCTIPRSSLCHIKALHVDLQGNIHIGEMVCNKAIAADLVEIFRALYDNKYPIERMVLIDEYGADDETSMRANNSSCFCYRTVSGTKTLSKHARGMAVDINTLYNPYVRKRANGSLLVQPSTATKYCDRSKKFDYKIESGDLCHRLFTQHGFRWGGAWRNTKDYQHFDK